MKSGWVWNAVTVALCVWILVELRSSPSPGPSAPELLELRAQLDRIAERQVQMQASEQSSRELLTELGRRAEPEEPNRERESTSWAQDPESKLLLERVARIEEAVQQRPGPNWTREIYSGTSWEALERRAPRLVPYEEFRALRPGTPYHVVVDRLGLPARMVGSLASELVLLYADPETADEFVEVEIGGGVLVSITGVPKQ